MVNFYYCRSKGGKAILMMMVCCLLGQVLRAQTLGTNIIVNGDAETISGGILTGWTDVADLGYPTDGSGGPWYLSTSSTYPSPSHGANQAHGGSYFFNAGISSNPGAGQTATLQHLVWCGSDLVNIRIEYLSGSTVVSFYDPQWIAANQTDVGWNNLTDTKNILASDQIDNINVILQARNDNTLNMIQAYYDDISLVATLPLPVTLVDFHALQQPDHTVALLWETALEQNSKYTEVQRSADGKTYLPIGQVVAAGNSSLPRDYAFTDESPLSGRGFYRLKMVDMDGSFKYSKILQVATGAGGTAIKVYSNPFHDQLGVQIPATAPEKLVLCLLDQTGKVCLRQNYTTQKGDNFINLYPAGMASGVYLLHIQGAQTERTIRVLKE